MLDDEEFHRVMSNRQPRTTDIWSEFTDVLREYELVTGEKLENPKPMWHQRLSMYGPPCKQCGKPVRTPRAKLCGTCMTPVSLTA